MDPQKQFEQAEVMLADAEARLRGKPCKVQFRRPGNTVWYNYAEGCFPSWEFERYEYRLAPEPRWRPWTLEEVPVGAVIRNKTHRTRAVIGCENSRCIISIMGVGDYTLTGLFDQWVQSDGTPCGVQEGGE